MIISQRLLHHLCPYGNQPLMDGVTQYFNKYSDKYGVNTFLRIAHFLAQAAEETAGMRTLVEYATGDEYEGRQDLGNVNPGDGRRYKGRGIFQITGRANYRKLGQELGYDLENNPELAATPEVAVQTALRYWTDHGLSPYADGDQVVEITRAINGGTNGLTDRENFLAQAKNLMELPDGIGIGDTGVEVTKIQQALVAHHIPVGVDGQYGPGTATGVKAFQKYIGVTQTGVVDDATAKALNS